MKRYTLLFLILSFSAFYLLSCSQDSSVPGVSDGRVLEENSTIIDDNSTTVDDNTTLLEPDFMRINLLVPTSTPEDEFICIGFNDQNPPIKMSYIDQTHWSIELKEEQFNSTQYRYCRNCECEAADEYFESQEIGWRNLAFDIGTTIEEHVTSWRWLDSALLNFELNITQYLLDKPAGLSSDFITGVMINDWWKASWMDSVEKTMQKIKTQSSSDWIQYTPIPEITQLYPLPIIVKDASNGTSDEELIQIINIAHEQGLKVFLNPSPWSFIEDTSPESHSQEWWDAFEQQWRPILLHYADLAQNHGVEMFEFKMWPNIDALNTQEKQKMNALSSQLLTDTRTHYNKGEIAVQSICYDIDRPLLDVHYSADVLAINLWSYYPWHLGSSKDDNVDDIYAIVTTRLDECHTYYTDHNLSTKILIEQLSAASYDGAIIGSSVDDESLSPFYPNSEEYPFDLQEQADLYEAVLHALSQRSWIAGSFAFTYFYWDSMDKDINIRSKPAEKVLSKWYQWFQEEH